MAWLRATAMSQPPKGPSALPVPVERLVHLDEDLLRQVLGLVHPAREPVGEAEHLPGVPGHQLSPGGLVTVPAPRQEIGVASIVVKGLVVAQGDPLPSPAGTHPGAGEFEKVTGEGAKRAGLTLGGAL